MGKNVMLKIMATLCAFLFCMGIAGAYAVWIYPADSQPGEQKVNMGLGEFVYTPEEVLPDDNEAIAQQKNHLAVIEEILFNSKMGLNSKDALANAINRYGLLNYLETIQGGNLKHLIDSTDSGKNLGFVLEYIDETQFYIYTFYRLGHKDGERITVYRTLFKENNDPNVDKDGDGRMDEWIAYSSHSGTAVAKILLDSQFTIINTTWQIGTSVKK